ncbi:MAG: ATP-binding cassette domain-containing protein [Bdellovibrionota bacterium]
MFKIRKKIKKVFAQLLFSDGANLIKLYKKNGLLQVKDLFLLPDKLNPRFSKRAFESLKLENSWGFLWGIFKAITPGIVVVSALAFLLLILKITAPLVIHDLIQQISQIVKGAGSVAHGIGLSLLLCLVGVLQALVGQHYFYHALHSEYIVIMGLNFRVFSKALTITREGLLRRGTGETINYLGADTTSVAMFPWSVIELSYSALLILAVFSLLFNLLGVAALAAVAVLVVFAPLSSYLGKYFVKLDELIMKHRDQRVAMVSQIISSIRVVKYFAWETESCNDIRNLRDKELRERKKLATAESFSVVMYLLSSTLACLLAFVCYLQMGNTLDAATVFSSLALFGILEAPFGNLTHFISHIASARVSGERIRNFLLDDNIGADDRELSPKNHPVGIRLKEVTFSYQDGKSQGIRDISLEIQPGESVAIVGPVGAGKSTLLMLMLGELKPLDGGIEYTNISSDLFPRLSWAPQESFVRNGLLRDNILFGASADLLQEALEVTMLEEDIGLMPAGLHTEIGEQGINLSGGQKQRLGLARSVVSQPGLALLDDSLSAVDVDTENELVSRLLFGRWASITRIVSTHRLQHLDKFDRIIFLENGRMLSVGKYQELLQDDARFLKFIKDHEYSNHCASELKEQMKDGLAARLSKDQGLVESNNEKLGGTKLIVDEDRETGAVKNRIFLDYFKAMAGDVSRKKVVLFFLIMMSVMPSILGMLQTAWLSMWTNPEKSSSVIVSSIRALLGDSDRNIAIYGILGLLVLAAYLGQHLLWSLRSLAAGKVLHQKAFESVVRSKVRFFDTTPVGRILNRLSNDVDVIERDLPWTLTGATGAFFSTVVSLCLLVAVLPILLFFIVPILFVYYRIQRNYRGCNRDLRRLESLTKSPRFAHFKETLEGLSVIRGIRKSDLFLEDFYRYLSNNVRVSHALICLNRWFTVRVSLLGGVISIATTTSLIYAARAGWVQAGTAGLVLLYALGLWEGLNWCIRAFSMAESSMTSAERLLSYAKLQSEKQIRDGIEINDNRLSQSIDESWRPKGEITFDGVVARYADDLPDVLKGISFSIAAGSKAGFVGRTGSGKSTIFQLLYRFLEVRKGEICIDGRNIAGIPLYFLRKNIAMIPQDTTLFIGTLRSNLDRFNRFTDAEIWDVLDRVQLADFLNQNDYDLNTQVRENGLNFSQGQRQLFCLARALLVNASIIVMDEVTASVDVETDLAIQETLRKECKDQTVLIIAHRLGTLSDCDVIFELDDGIVKSKKNASGLLPMDRKADLKANFYIIE